MKHPFTLLLMLATLLAALLPVAYAYPRQLRVEDLKALFPAYQISAMGRCHTFLVEDQRCVALGTGDDVAYIFVLAADPNEKNDKSMNDAQAVADRLFKYLEKRYNRYGVSLKPFADGKSGYFMHFGGCWKPGHHFSDSAPVNVLRTLKGEIYGMEGTSIVVANPAPKIAKVAFDLTTATIACIKIVPDRNAGFGDEFRRGLTNLPNIGWMYKRNDKAVQKKVGVKCIGVGIGPGNGEALVQYRNVCYYGAVNKLSDFFKNKKHLNPGTFKFPNESNKLPNAD